MSTLKNYRDFLDDNDFIAWRMTRDETLDTYWIQYIQNHQDETEAFEQAIEYFSRFHINKAELSENEYAKLWQRIETVEPRYSRPRKTLRLILRYAAVACVAIAAVGISEYYLSRNNVQDVVQPLADIDMVVGSVLDEQDIQLITNSETMSFSDDVRVHIDEEGSALVEERNGGARQVATGKSAKTKLVVPYGKRSQLTLSDGTRVWVNSGSVLEFPSTFTEDVRSVNLSGEMYIEVAEDASKPFIVNTSGFDVKVYGTKFNVSAYPDISQSIVLVEGSVGVNTAEATEIVMAPNEMLTVNNTQWEKSSVDVSGYISWKDGYILLNGTPMIDVLKYIERYYNLTFHIPDNSIQNHRCRGKLYLSNELDNVLKTISLLSATEYKRENGIIYININPKKRLPMKRLADEY